MGARVSIVSGTFVQVQSASGLGPQWSTTFRLPVKQDLILRRVGISFPELTFTPGLPYSLPDFAGTPFTNVTAWGNERGHLVITSPIGLGIVRGLWHIEPWRINTGILDTWRLLFAQAHDVEISIPGGASALTVSFYLPWMASAVQLNATYPEPNLLPEGQGIVSAMAIVETGP